jgi:tRNA(Ile)-lysidine synthetase-like protein
VAAAHVEKILALVRSGQSSGSRVPLPGGREAVFSFESLHLGRVRPRPTPFALPLLVPGRVVAPGGLAFTARNHEGPPVSNPYEAVVAAGEGDLVVRNPRPGDRVWLGGRAQRLNRVFMERRVPRDLRVGYPVVASGDAVLFVPGETLDPPEGPGTGRLVLIAVGS